MGFSFSGRIAEGASQALDEVLQRRLQEHARRTQERQHAEQVEIQRKQIDLQQRRDAAMDVERQEDRKRVQQQDDIAAAGRMAAQVEDGPQTPEAAAIMRKDPVLAARLSDRPIINASPIAAQSVLPGAVAPQPAGDVTGPSLRTIDAQPITPTPTAMGGAVTATPDTSGPQSTTMFAPTPQQTNERDIYGQLSRAGNQAERQRIAIAGAGRGVKVDPRYVEATEAEERATALQTQLDAEARMDDRWYQHEGWSLRNQKEHPSVWVSKEGAGEQFVTPTQASALARQGWKHSTTAPGSTEDERKSVGFYRQMTQAIDIMDGLENQLSDRDLYQIQSLPQEDLIGLMNRGQMSEAAKRYVRAFEQFTEARLRPVSGAVINDSEFLRDRRTYAKQFHETPTLNADRRAARDVQVETLQLRAGRAFKDTPVHQPNTPGGGGGGRPRFNPATNRWE